MDAGKWLGRLRFDVEKGNFPLFENAQVAGDRFPVTWFPILELAANGRHSEIYFKARHSAPETSNW
jgi:hypothetical protein